MKKFRFMIPVILWLCLMGQTTWATNAYVTDFFRISLRRGPSIENKILKFLPSGMPVEILKTQEGWSYIQHLDSDDNDVRGWVLSRYLITRLPWEQQVRSLKEEIGPLKEKLAGIENELAEAAKREQKLSKELREYIDAHNKLQDEYRSLKKASADYLNLKAAFETIRQTVKTLTIENEDLRISQMNKWFAIGALVLLCGLMIGLVIGRQQKRRRSLYF